MDLSPPPKKRPKAHANVYLDAEAVKRLEDMKKVNAEWAIERVRRALEKEIEAMWRLFQAMGRGK
jgi:hypothetical protein